MNFVTPGTATGAYGSGPHSYLGGDRSSFEFSAICQVIFIPVYVAIRPMIDISVLCAPSRPLFNGSPARRPANISMCSWSYISDSWPSYAQVLPPLVIECGGISSAEPFVPKMWALVSLNTRTLFWRLGRHAWE